MTRKFTNIPEVAAADPEFKHVPDVLEEGRSPTFPSDEKIAADPRMGMSPQGTFDFEKTQRAFPELFPWLSDDILAPEEEAKRQMGLPFDASKRFVPQRSDVQEPDPMDRRTFENIVFQEIGGNPFFMDPYQEVVKADAQLPALFNHVFQGHATWSDLPKLSKEQRAFWEDVKRQHHARVYEQAKSQKKQMLDAYNWMMTTFDNERKEEFAQAALEEKKRAEYESSLSKEPTWRNIYNDMGVQTLHGYDPKTGKWFDTGQRTGAYSLEDQMPPDVRFAYGIVKQYAPDIPRELLMMAAFSKDTAMIDRIEKLYTRNIPPEDKANYDIAKKKLDAWFSEQGKRLEEGKGEPGAERPQGGWDPDFKTQELKHGGPGSERGTAGVPVPAESAKHYVWDPQQRRAVPREPK